MEIASFSPSHDGAIIPPAPTAVVAQVANVVASDHSHFTASEEGLVVVHTASRVVEQTTIVVTQQE